MHGSCGGGSAADFSNLDAGVGEKGEQEVDPLMNGSIVCSNTAAAVDTCSSVTIHGEWTLIYLKCWYFWVSNTSSE